MREVIGGLNSAAYPRHMLHDAARAWPQTNCYTDLWIEVLAASGNEPRAALGFTLAQDFEGDQFTFFKFALEDLDTLYGIRTTELSIFDSLIGHIGMQIERGRLPLVEVDGYYLPDTRGVSWHETHPKTTIAINGIDVDARRMTYFHNDGYFALEGEDFDGLFGEAPQGEVRLFPYVEFVKFPVRPQPLQIADMLGATRRHLMRRPASNPLRAYAQALPGHIAELARRPESFFHLYAFNTARQIGANFELAADHLALIGTVARIDTAQATSAARVIADGAKVFQFKLARAAARGTTRDLDSLIAPMADAWDRLMTELDNLFDASRAAA